MKIAAIQMVSTTSVERNLDAARALVGRAAAEGAVLAVLPEYFCIMGKTDRAPFVIARGLDLPGSGRGRDLIRPAAEDLFR